MILCMREGEGTYKGIWKSPEHTENKRRNKASTLGLAMREAEAEWREEHRERKTMEEQRRGEEGDREREYLK